MAEATRTDGYYHKIDGDRRTSAAITMNNYGDIWFTQHHYTRDDRGFWQRSEEIRNLELRTNSWARAVEMLTETIAQGGWSHSSEIRSSSVL
jgi:hypothetical protein